MKNKREKRGRFKSGLGGLGLVLWATVAIPQVQAQNAVDQAITLKIPGGALGTAISRFGDTAGLQILYPADLVRGKMTSGISGQFTSQQALEKLLEGTGLIYRFTDTETVTIMDPTAAGSGIAPDGSTLLDTISVTTARNKNRIATLGGLADEDANYRTAGSSAFLDEQKIQRFRGSSVGDFIKGTPGVLTGDNRNSGAIDVNVRGMQGFGRVPVVIDGTVQQNTVYRGYSGVASRNYVDPDMIGGAVIEKGPSASVYGVGATGGLVRMETINANDIIKDGRNWGVRVRGGMMGNTSSPPAVGTPGGYAPMSIAFHNRLQLGLHA